MKLAIVIALLVLFVAGLALLGRRRQGSVADEMALADPKPPPEVRERHGG
jgi:hypothetical protein